MIQFDQIFFRLKSSQRQITCLAFLFQYLPKMLSLKKHLYTNKLSSYISYHLHLPSILMLLMCVYITNSFERHYCPTLWSTLAIRGEKLAVRCDDKPTNLTISRPSRPSHAVGNGFSKPKFQQLYPEGEIPRRLRNHRQFQKVPKRVPNFFGR